MSTSPTPSEKEQKDKDDRAREAEEQAKLPYKWTQTIQDLDITVAVPGNLRGKDIVVEMKKDYLKVGVKGQDPIIDVSTAPRLIPFPISTSILTPSQRTGSPPPLDPPLRINMDARTHSHRQRNLPPPRQNQQNAMVGLCHHQRPLLPRHIQNPARELKTGGFRWRNEGNGGENDV